MKDRDIKLVIFDYDGVLADVELLHNSVSAQSLREQGVDVTDEESLRLFTGISSKSARELIKDKFGITIPESETDKVQRKVVDLFEEKLEPVKGVRELLEYLEEVNMPSCVASGSPLFRIEKGLEVFDFKKYFPDEEVFYAAQVANGKPAPDVFLLAAERMGVRPSQCLVIEDSISGVEAAKAAGMKVVILVAGKHTQIDWFKERLVNTGVPILEEAMEVISHLNKSKSYGSRDNTGMAR